MNHRNHDHEQQHQQEPAQASSRTGWMERHDQARVVIAVGQMVYTNLYGRGVGVVVRIHGVQEPRSCTGMGDVIRQGGRAMFDIAFEDGWSRRLPETILRGVQWQIGWDVLSAAAVRKAEFQADEAEEEKRVAEAARKAEFALRVADLRNGTAYPFLQVGDETTGKGQGLAAKNIRRHLKHAFPGVRFGVRQSRGASSIDISWTDGPTEAEVDAIASMYDAGSFDGMTDCYNYIADPFTEVYGSTRYTFTRREFSDELIAHAIAYVFEHHDFELPDWTPTVADYRSGQLYRVPVASMLPLVNDLQALIRAVAYRTRRTPQGFEMTVDPRD